MKKLNSLGIYARTALISLAVSVLAFALTIPFFFFSLKEIPLGILLGGSIGSLVYWLFELIDKKKIKLTVVLIVVKFFVLAGITILDAYLYYKLEIKIFNIFAILGSYLISLIVYLINYRKEDNNDLRS